MSTATSRSSGGTLTTYLFVLDHVLGEVSVGPLDPSLGEIAGDAEVLPLVAAGRAALVRARPAHRQHRKVAWGHAGDPAPDLDDFPQRFVTHDQVSRSGRRLSVFEGGDLAVGAADAGFENAQLDISRPLD